MKRRWRSTAALCAFAMASPLFVAVSATPAPAAAQTAPQEDETKDLGGLAALNTAIAAGELPVGTYNIASPLSLSTGATVSAVEPGRTTIRFTGVRDSTVKVTGTGVTIQGVTITGGSNTNGNGGGISIASGASLTLVDSTVTDNKAREGGGIYNAGVLTIERSTIVNNEAGRKGGGLRDDGTTTIVNSTFNANVASQGGAVSSAGTTDMLHTTIVGNVATSSSSAGVDRNGGTMTVSYSIIGGNLRTNGSTASDCSGTPDLLESLVSDATGCNPVGEIYIGEPGVMAPDDNGGPTETMALLETSQALDKVVATDGTCASGVSIDQRSRDRIGGENTRCDLGAYEESPQLEISASLAVETDAYQEAPRSLPDGTVEVGAVSVAIDKIASELAAATIPTATEGQTEEQVEAARLYRIRLYRIGLYRIAAEGVSLDDLDDTAVGPVEEILASIGLLDIAERTILSSKLPDGSPINPDRLALPAVPLSTVPLLLDGGWDSLLADTEFAGLPFQSITLEDLAANEVTDAPNVPARPKIEGLTLADVDLTNSVLNDIDISTLLLSGLPLKDVPFGDTSQGIPIGDPAAGYAAAWCQALFSTEECTPEFITQVGDANMWEAQLSGGAVNQIPTLEVPLEPASLEAARLYRIGLYRIGLYRIRLYRIFLENSALQSIRLYRIAERTAPAVDGFDEVKIGDILKCDPDNPATDPCSKDPSNTLTLADVAASCPTINAEGCLLQENATIGQLIDLLGVEIDGTTLLDDLNLYDLLLAFLPPADIPWESVDLETAGLQNIAGPPAQPTFDYVTSVDVVNGPATVDVTVDLPKGFAVAAAESATWCVTGGACTDIAANPDPQPDPEVNAVSYSVAEVETGSYELRVPVRAGLTVGTFDTVATVAADGPNGSPLPLDLGPVPVNVVAAAVGGPNTAPTLAQGQLALGHIGSDEDFDVYQFTAPAGSTGSEARVLLSNVPEGVDYDLAVFSKRPASLRGEPVESLTTIVDAPFDLNPTDDVLSTDVVNDIAIDLDSVTVPGLNAAGFVLRDLSSRRANSNEEVSVPGLVAGDKYIVVVATYFSGFSPEPYGLRVRLDGRTAAPECAVSPYLNIPAASTPAIPTELAVDSDVNTLYVTNRARLEHDLLVNPTSVDGVPVTSDDIILEMIGTQGVNSVDAGLLLLDDLTRIDDNGTADTSDDVEINLWSAWDANPCDVAARNAVVTAIGEEIDEANGRANGGIENLVIVGADGVVPMAAIPDLTVYANESTFANEALGAGVGSVTGDTKTGLSNAVSGAMSSGYFLSDDPYATDNGIEILGGDHELYLPTRNIGRLVETGEEILGQLRNFSVYGGNLDPETLSGTALVTGYDFLDDGAAEITDTLSADFGVTALDGSTNWSNDVLLGKFEGADFDVFSTNAHYDFEALLPAAADSAVSYTDADLVSTSDFGAPGDPNTTDVPVGALGFVVGCHAGLSRSDVQLGLTSLDWAQLYGGNSTQWVAHTTFGYGDSELVAYSERLAAVFAEKVAAMKAGAAGAPTSLGQALREAKQDFLGGTMVLTPYDEKVMQSWTYYGMPMFALGDEVPGGDTTTTSNLLLAEAAGVAPASMLFDQTSGPADFGAELDNGSVPVSIDLTGRLDENVVPGRGTFYSVGGDTIAAQYRPTQPLVDVEIPGATPGQFAGFLITELSTTDFGPDYVPYISRPLIDDEDIEGASRPADAAFPATLQRITDTVDGQRALIAAGQYFQNQQLFPKISGELIPSLDATLDTTVPRFIDVEATNVSEGANGAVRFDIQTEVRSGDNANTATRVVVVYREQGQLGWESEELTEGAAGSWSGTATLFSSDPDVNVQWFAQLVDRNGAVGITRNKVEYFDAVAEIQPSAPIPQIIPGTTNQLEGRYFTTGATFTITNATRFRVDEGTAYDITGTTEITIEAIQPGEDAGFEFDPQVPDTGVLRVATGSHLIEAENAVEGSSTSFAARFFIVDGVGPDVAFTGTQAVDPLWTKNPVTLSVAASDAGVGIDKVCAEGQCAGDLDGDGVAELTLESIGADPGTVVDRDVSAIGTDRLGNETTVTTRVRIDAAPPVVTITTNPAPNSAGWNNTIPTLEITVDDVGSGIERVCIADVDNECVTDLPGPDYAVTVDPASIDPATGTVSVRVRADDKADNRTIEIVELSIDEVAPVGQIDTIAGLPLSGDPKFDGILSFGEAATITYSCSDALSGMATCQLLAGTTVVDADGPSGGTYPFPATTIGTTSFTVQATDLAGKSSTTTTPVEVLVGYRTCEDYNPNQAKKAGSAYPITVRLCDAERNTVIVPGAVLTALTVDGKNDPGPQFPGNSNEAYQFKDNGNGSYSYNIKTDGLLKGTHQLSFTYQPLPAERSTLTNDQLQALATNFATFSTR